MNYDSIIANLYAAANGRAEWGAALTGVADYLDLWTVQVLGIDKRNGRLVFSVHGGQSSAQTGLDYFRHYHYIDPRAPLITAMPVGPWFHCHEHFDDAYVAQSPFYQEFLVAHGGRYVSSTILLDDHEVVYVLALLRGIGNVPLTQTHADIFGQLAHHFAEALKNLVHTRDSFVELGMARELLDPLDHPMLLVDETRGIWHSNPRAAAMLEDGSVVSERAGMLVCHDKVSEDSLFEAIASLENGGALQETHGRRVVRLRGKNGQTCLAFVSAVGPGRTMGAFGSGARALIILHQPDHVGTTLDPLVAAECFDFTPAEARIAVQIAEGASAKEIAQRSGAALPTVRTHIQRVMEKAGVERQGDLIRMLLSLPVRGIQG